jgi:hypothetical protein
MYKAGKLGVDPRENLRLWDACLRFKATVVHATEGKEPVEHYSETRDWRDYINWAALIADPHGTYQGIPVFTPGDAPEGWGVSDDCEVVDVVDPNDMMDPGADIAEDLVAAKQTIGLLADTLGPDFRILKHAIVHDWTPRTLAETDGYGHRVTGAAYGMGMIRSALRQLAYFWDRLDSAERCETPRKFFPLAGFKALSAPH